MSVVGPEPDLATLSETELGALAALIGRPRRAIATARASRQGEELAPTRDTDPVVIPYPDPLLRRIVARLNAV